MTELPEPIGTLANLAELGLGFNRFAEVPVPLRALTSLDELYLGGNRITELPHARSTRSVYSTFLTSGG